MLWNGKGLACETSPGGIASKLTIIIYVAMTILYDSSDSPNDSNLKYESRQPYQQLWLLNMELCGLASLVPRLLPMPKSDGEEPGYEAMD